MNLINDLESDLAMAVLLEKRHAEKINSEDLLPLIKRINDALETVSAKTGTVEASPAGKAGASSH